MARWVWPAAAGVVTSATGVAINLATDGGANPWAWTTVALLTALGVVIALRVQSTPPPEVAPRTTPPATPPEASSATPPHTPATATPQLPPTTVHNSVTGTVSGGVVQAGHLGSVTINSPTTVNQNATAHEGGTIYQAGRDVRRD